MKKAAQIFGIIVLLASVITFMCCVWLSAFTAIAWIMAEFPHLTAALVIVGLTAFGVRDLTR